MTRRPSIAETSFSDDLDDFRFDHSAEAPRCSRRWRRSASPCWDTRHGKFAKREEADQDITIEATRQMTGRLMERSERTMA